MDKPIKLIQGETYIFQKRTYPNPVKKLKIRELTKTSIYVQDVDQENSYRDELHTFNREWKPIEVMPNKLIESLMREADSNMG